MKPEGLLLNRRIVPTQMHANIMTTYLEPLIQRRTPLEYFSVTRSNHLSNATKNRAMKFLFFSRCEGRSRSVQRAGVSDKAINAERITEMAMVMANCWYNLPTIPGIKPTGTNTAARIRAMATTGDRK